MAVAFTQGQCYGRPDGTNHPSAATHTPQQHPRTQPNQRLPSLTEPPLQGYQAERPRDRSSKQTIWVKLPSRTRDRSAILVQQRFRIALPPPGEGTRRMSLADKGLSNGLPPLPQLLDECASRTEQRSQLKPCPIGRPARGLRDAGWFGPGRSSSVRCPRQSPWRSNRGY